MLLTHWKDGLLLGAALVLGSWGVADLGQPAQASAGAKIVQRGPNHPNGEGLFVNFTGTYALYNKPGDLPGAKVVRHKRQLLKLNASTKSQQTFMFCQEARSNHGTVYYRVRTQDHTISGWIYAGKITDSNRGLIYREDGQPAGGVTAFFLSKPAKLTSEEATGFYRFKTPTDYAPGGRSPFAGPTWVRSLGVKSTANTPVVAQAHATYIVTSAVTLTREGTRWLHIVSLTGADEAYDGYVQASALRRLPAVKPAKGITVKVMAADVAQPLKTLVVPYVANNKGRGLPGMDLGALSAYAGLPVGYTVGTRAGAGFGGQDVSQVLRGATVTLHVKSTDD